MITSSSNEITLTTNSASAPLAFPETHKFIIKTSKSVRFFSDFKLKDSCSIESTGTVVALVELGSLDFTTSTATLNLLPNVDIKAGSLICYPQSGTDVSFPITYSVTTKKISTVTVTGKVFNLKESMKFNLRLTEPENMLQNSDEVCKDWTLLEAAEG